MEVMVALLITMFLITTSLCLLTSLPVAYGKQCIYLDGLLKNTSDIQPDTLHADTQGQSSPVFALAHLLGIKLMPRIRNWKDCNFYHASADDKTALPSPQNIHSPRP